MANLRCNGCYAEQASIRGIGRVLPAWVAEAEYIVGGLAVCSRHYAQFLNQAPPVDPPVDKFQRFVPGGNALTRLQAALGQAPIERTSLKPRRKRTGVRA